MDNYLYDAVCAYFNHLCNTGYTPYKNVEKLLVMSSIRRLVDCDFRGHLNKEDYNKINAALNCLYGSSCLLPYPDYYSNKNRRIMYTCSISELAHRVSELEEHGTPGGANIDDKTIVVPSDNSIEVNDVPVDGIDE